MDPQAEVLENPASRVVALLSDRQGGPDGYLGSVLGYDQRICLVGLSEDLQTPKTLTARVVDRRMVEGAITHFYRITTESGHEMVIEGPLVSRWFEYNYPRFNWQELHGVFLEKVSNKLDGIAIEQGIRPDGIFIWFFAISNRKWEEVTSE